MKRKILTTAMLALAGLLTFTALPQKAQAEHQSYQRRVVRNCSHCHSPVYSYRVISYYDSCGRPAYRWVTHSHSRCGSRYRTSYRHYSHYGYGHGYRHSYRHHRPRVRFNFSLGHH